MRRFGPSTLLGAALLAAVGCGGSGGPVGLSANAAHFDKRMVAGPATLHIRGHNCSSLYGRWSVRLEVSGAVKGSGRTQFTLSPRRESEVPVSFPIQAGPIPGRALGSLHVGASGSELTVRGKVQVRVPLRTLSRTIDERIRVNRGPSPSCGLSG